MELDDASQLLDVSKDQYDEILSVIQHHTDETVNWLSNIVAKFSWVGQTLTNSSVDPDKIFVINKVRRERKALHISISSYMALNTIVHDSTEVELRFPF